MAVRRELAPSNPGMGIQYVITAKALLAENLLNGDLDYTASWLTDFGKITREEKRDSTSDACEAVLVVPCR